jgi:hypothetical protein
MKALVKIPKLSSLELQIPRTCFTGVGVLDLRLPSAKPITNNRVNVPIESLEKLFMEKVSFYGHLILHSF